ncbi:hypothetical protein Tco_0149048 [Tanacetum coccineum]
MADKGKKSCMETFVPNDKADYYSGITSITVNGKNAYELKGKFLDDMHNNAFSGTNRKDAVEHIEYYLKINDSIKLPNVDHDKLRIVVFPISLARGALWDYWKMGGDEIKDLEEYWSNTEETTEIFKIKTDVFYYETPLCLAFNEFNYILKVDPDLLTKDIMGFKTYEDYKDDWIYEWNENVPWVYDKPWLDNGIWKEPKPVSFHGKLYYRKLDRGKWVDPTSTAIIYAGKALYLSSQNLNHSHQFDTFRFWGVCRNSYFKFVPKAFLKGPPKPRCESLSASLK